MKGGRTQPTRPEPPDLNSSWSQNLTPELRYLHFLAKVARLLDDEEEDDKEESDESRKRSKFAAGLDFCVDDSSVLVEGQGVDIIPEVASSYRPVKGMMFSSIDQAFDFYCGYAKKAGFGARKGGSYVHGGVLKTKYFTCCKEGQKPAKMYDSKGDYNESSKPYYKRRKMPTIRCCCRAHIQLKSVDGGFFEVDDFVEGHNHRMVADSDMQFVRSARKLTHVQEEAIYELSNMNFGPVKAFNLMRTQYGGFEKAGATKDDCKNFKQVLNCYIREYDAEIIVQRLCAKKRFSSDYSFEYDVNDDRELIRMFWADETSKGNYLAFGDIISFDATFKTNK
ncbi:protein FAR1-RELATED SEQUENCE 5-like [Bidens hawaiensis]|uniref:protein FAR1-RELATED SEQUENCE 5-like n=1 Tax=Bidens hawaiensis TaxID=980011 RepID=UPI004049CDB1